MARVACNVPESVSSAAPPPERGGGIAECEPGQGIAAKGRPIFGTFRGALTASIDRARDVQQAAFRERWMRSMEEDEAISDAVKRKRNRTNQEAGTQLGPPSVVEFGEEDDSDEEEVGLWEKRHSLAKAAAQVAEPVPIEVEEENAARSTRGAFLWKALRQHVFSELATPEHIKRLKKGVQAAQSLFTYHEMGRRVEKIKRHVNRFLRECDTSRYNRLVQELETEAVLSRSDDIDEELQESLAQTDAIYRLLVARGDRANAAIWEIEEEENQLAEQQGFIDDAKETEQQIQDQFEGYTQTSVASLTQALQRMLGLYSPLLAEVRALRQHREQRRKAFKEFTTEVEECNRRIRLTTNAIQEIMDIRKDREWEEKRKMENLRKILVDVNRVRNALERKNDETRKRIKEIYSRTVSRLEAKMKANLQEMAQHRMERQVRQAKSDQIALQREITTLLPRVQEKEEECRLLSAELTVLNQRGIAVGLQSLNVGLMTYAGELASDGSVRAAGFEDLEGMNPDVLPDGVLQQLLLEVSVQRQWLHDRAQYFDFDPRVMKVLRSPLVSTPFFLLRDLRAEMARADATEKVVMLMRSAKARGQMRLAMRVSKQWRAFVLRRRAHRDTVEAALRAKQEQEKQELFSGLARQASGADHVYDALEKILRFEDYVQDDFPDPSLVDQVGENLAAIPNLLSRVGAVSSSWKQHRQDYTAVARHLGLPSVKIAVGALDSYIADMVQALEVAQKSMYFFSETARRVGAFGDLLLTQQFSWLPALYRRLAERCGLLRAATKLVREVYFQHLASDGGLTADSDEFDRVCAAIVRGLDGQPMLNDDQLHRAAETLELRVHAALRQRIAQQKSAYEALRWYVGKQTVAQMRDAQVIGHKEEPLTAIVLRGLEAIANISLAPKLTEMGPMANLMGNEVVGIIRLTLARLFKAADPEAWEGSLIALEVLDNATHAMPVGVYFERGSWQGTPFSEVTQGTSAPDALSRQVSPCSQGSLPGDRSGPGISPPDGPEAGAHGSLDSRSSFVSAAARAGARSIASLARGANRSRSEGSDSRAASRSRDDASSRASRWSRDGDGDSGGLSDSDEDGLSGGSSSFFSSDSSIGFGSSMTSSSGSLTSSEDEHSVGLGGTAVADGIHPERSHDTPPSAPDLATSRRPSLSVTAGSPSDHLAASRRPSLSVTAGSPSEHLTVSRQPSLSLTAGSPSEQSQRLSEDGITRRPAADGQVLGSSRPQSRDVEQGSRWSGSRGSDRPQSQADGDGSQLAAKEDALARLAGGAGWGSSDDTLGSGDSDAGRKDSAGVKGASLRQPNDGHIPTVDGKLSPPEPQPDGFEKPVAARTSESRQAVSPAADSALVVGSRHDPPKPVSRSPSKRARHRRLNARSLPGKWSPGSDVTPRLQGDEDNGCRGDASSALHTDMVVRPPHARTSTSAGSVVRRARFDSSVVGEKHVVEQAELDMAMDGDSMVRKAQADASAAAARAAKYAQKAAARADEKAAKRAQRAERAARHKAAMANALNYIAREDLTARGCLLRAYARYSLRPSNGRHRRRRQARRMPSRGQRRVLITEDPDNKSSASRSMSKKGTDNGDDADAAREGQSSEVAPGWPPDGSDSGALADALEVKPTPRKVAFPDLFNLGSDEAEREAGRGKGRSSPSDKDKKKVGGVRGAFSGLRRVDPHEEAWKRKSMRTRTTVEDLAEALVQDGLMPSGAADEEGRVMTRPSYSKARQEPRKTERLEAPFRPLKEAGTGPVLFVRAVSDPSAKQEAEGAPSTRRDPSKDAVQRGDSVAQQRRPSKEEDIREIIAKKARKLVELQHKHEFERRRTAQHNSVVVDQNSSCWEPKKDRKDSNTSSRHSCSDILEAHKELKAFVEPLTAVESPHAASLLQKALAQLHFDLSPKDEPGTDPLPPVHEGSCGGADRRIARKLCTPSAASDSGDSDSARSPAGRSASRRSTRASRRSAASRASCVDHHVFSPKIVQDLTEDGIHLAYEDAPRVSVKHRSPGHVDCGDGSLSMAAQSTKAETDTSMPTSPMASVSVPVSDYASPAPLLREEHRGQRISKKDIDHNVDGMALLQSERGTVQWLRKLRPHDEVNPSAAEATESEGSPRKRRMIGGAGMGAQVRAAFALECLLPQAQLPECMPSHLRLKGSRPEPGYFGYTLRGSGDSLNLMRQWALAELTEVVGTEASLTPGRFRKNRALFRDLQDDGVWDGQGENAAPSSLKWSSWRNPLETSATPEPGCDIASSPTKPTAAAGAGQGAREAPSMQDSLSARVATATAAPSLPIAAARERAGRVSAAAKSSSKWATAAPLLEPAVPSSAKLAVQTPPAKRAAASAAKSPVSVSPNVRRPSRAARPTLTALKAPAPPMDGRIGGEAVCVLRSGKVIGKPGIRAGPEHGHAALGDHLSRNWGGACGMVLAPPGADMAGVAALNRIGARSHGNAPTADLAVAEHEAAAQAASSPPQSSPFFPPDVLGNEGYVPSGAVVSAGVAASLVCASIPVPEKPDFFGSCSHPSILLRADGEDMRRAEALDPSGV